MILKHHHNTTSFITRLRLLAAAAAVMLVGAVAQAQTPGTWRAFSVFTGTVDQMIETPGGTVYFLTGGSLYSFDGTETYAFSNQNRLSGTGITGIFYNPAKDYLLVAYSNGNMDFLLSDGRTVNMPDFRDASVTTTRAIHDVAFGGKGTDRAYVATDFGLIILDDSRFEVRESARFPKPVLGVDVNGPDLWVYTDYAVMHAPVEGYHDVPARFTQAFGADLDDFDALSHDKVMYVKDGKFQLVDNLLQQDGEYNRSDVLATVAGAKRFMDSQDGLYLPAAGAIVAVDPQGAITTKKLPAALSGAMTALWESPDRVWAATEDGVGRYDIAGTAVTVLNEPYKPEAVTFNKVAEFTLSPDGATIYATPLSVTQHKGFMAVDNWIPQKINAITGGHVADISPAGYTQVNSWGATQQKKYPGSPLVCGNGPAVFSPHNPGLMLIPGYGEGFIFYLDGHQLRTLGKQDFPYTDNGKYVLAMGASYDSQGNLWLAQEGDPTKEPAIAVLSAAKAKLLEQMPSREDVPGAMTGAVTSADFKPLTYATPANGFRSQKNVRMAHTRQGNITLAIHERYNASLLAVDLKGTPDNPADDAWKVWETFKDQDGKDFRPIHLNCIVTDQEDRIWMGTSDGVVEFTRPAQFTTDPSARINHLKVPRNDGTNYADYLLAGENVLFISVDPSNRKWITTETSGAYLVSPNGDQILEHYDTSNSLLPANQVNAVMCDPQSNNVYFGTNYGIYVYTSDSAPGAEDYTDIVAYPNPVTPDYTGWVTIRGLMPGSLVKVVNASGAVVAQLKAEGGMALWDGCSSTAAGERVPSGVYYVMASQNQDETGPKGALAKILVIR